MAGLLAGALAFAAQAASKAPAADGIRIEPAWITLPDGVRLSADLYQSEGAATGEKRPVLLEYLPYRKHEARSRNYPLYSYFVERGYVVAAVDIRGTGNSEGRLIPHEYSEIELQDGEAVIDWLAQQPWSNGKVGMFGISWGGVNSIQMAARPVPALKAIIAIDATEDLYQDDVHFMDGILHLDSWEMSMDLDNARPGAPDYVIDDANFRDRFDTEPWMLTYKTQQRDGPFWDRGSVRGRYDDIRIPTFHIGGWYDGYRDSVARMLENVKHAPVKAIMGAWHHTWPHQPYPGPGIEWRHEAVRWFDQFLKGKDTGILDEPRFAVFVRNWHPPGPYLEHAPGNWRYEDGWPLARIQQRVFYPQDDHTLGSEAPAAATHQLRYLPAVGVEAGGPVMWWGDVAHDQRGTDAFSLVYDSPPLEADLEILGFPRALLTVAADATRANWIARLSDVAPDGTVTQVAGAAMNGTHRESARDPKAIVPGEPFELDIEMHFTSWVFPKGHRIRLAVNNAQWPMLWPTPEPMTTTLQLAGSRLGLPVVPYEKRPVPAFLPPAEDPEFPGVESLDSGTTSGYGEISSVDRNPATGVTVAKATNGSGTRYPWGTERSTETIRYEVADDAPSDAKVRGTHRMEVELPGRRLVWDAELSFTSDRENFYYRYVRRVSENDALLREKTWTKTIPRDYQ
ncbi:MAG: CocE/NonD family hydrolase [Steroidobacteraceae bacterium]